MEDNKENKSAYENTAYLSINQIESNSTANTVYSLNDTTILEDTLCESDDENFEELERMCNKTLSDPNNTIHSYIARQKMIKKQSAHEDDENVHVIDDNLNESKICMADQTQLNDIEAPSCLWETTISGDASTFQVSPLKFARQEPILEESSTESINSAFSFKTAQRCLETTSSDQYETANETIAEHRFDNTFCAENAQKKNNLSRNDSDVELIDLDGHAIVSNSWNYENVTKEISSLLDETLKISTDIKPKADYNLIDLDLSVHNGGSDQSQVTKEHSKVDAIILLSDDEDETEVEYNNSHNTGFSLLLDDSVTDIDAGQMNVSEEFNDTLDEINYIMKQGIKYFSENPTTPKGMKHLIPAITPSPISSPQTPNTVITKPKNITLHEKTGLELFKKPQVFSRIPQCKSLNAVKKPSHFQHIVSPVGAYIKNTPKTPITTELKPTQDVFMSKAVRGLDYSGKCSFTKKAEPMKDNGISLPKKAYISSEFKHVVDQRKQISIPGGEKIHRYLQSTKVPSVIRHEGKMKLNVLSHQRTDLCEKVADSSLADLSTISGDISVHILKDAKL